MRKHATNPTAVIGNIATTPKILAMSPPISGAPTFEISEDVLYVAVAVPRLTRESSTSSASPALVPTTTIARPKPYARVHGMKTKMSRMNGPANSSAAWRRMPT